MGFLSDLYNSFNQHVVRPVENQGGVLDYLNNRIQSGQAIPNVVNGPSQQFAQEHPVLGYLGYMGAGILNAPSNIANKGIINPVADVSNNATALASGQTPQYNQQLSAPGRLGVQLAGGGPQDATSYVKNVAGVADPIVQAYFLRSGANTVAGAAENTATNGVIRTAANAALHNAPIGAAQGAVSAAADSRATTLPELGMDTLKGGAQGAIGGAAMGFGGSLIGSGFQAVRANIGPKPVAPVISDGATPPVAPPNQFEAAAKAIDESPPPGPQPTIAPGEVPAKPVQQPVAADIAPVNEQVLANQKQGVLDQMNGQVGSTPRKFKTSVDESVLSQDVKDATLGSYDPKANKQLIADARQSINTDGALQRTNRLQQLDPKQFTDKDVTEAIVLAHEYGAQGHANIAADLLSHTAEALTEAGRAVQAASLLNRISPEGILYIASKEAKKAGITLSNEELNNFYKRADDIQKMPAGREQNIARKGLLDDLAAIVPTPWWQKAITTWKAGLLTGLKTTGRNVISNSINALSETAKDPIAAAADSLMSLKTGERTTSVAKTGYIEGATGKGFQSAKDIAKFGFDPMAEVSKFDAAKINWGKSVVGQILDKYTSTVFNFLAAQDRPFYEGALKRSLYDQAGAAAINAGKRGDMAFVQNLVEHPTETMAKTAIKDAQTAVFANNNAVKSAIQGARAKMEKFQPGSSAVLDIVAPFTGVPSSIAGQMVKYSPVGLVKGAFNTGKVLFGDKVPEGFQRQAAQDLARGVVGTGVMAIGSELARRGLITGAYPTDTKTQEQWKLEGRTANSILINGKWRTINSLGPQASMLLVGGQIGAKDGSFVDKASTGVAAGLKTLSDASFLSGVSGVLDAINDPNRSAAKYAKSTVSSVVPVLVGDSAKASDLDAQGNTITRENNTVVDAFTNKIPGLRGNNLPSRDVLGNVLTGQGPVQSMLDPLNSSTANNDPLVSELGRLNAQPDNSATPTKLEPTIEAFGQKLKLDPAQLDQLEQTSGGKLKQQMTATIQSPFYQQLPDDQKAKVLKDIIDQVRTAAKQDIIANGAPQASSSSLLGVDTAQAAGPSSTGSGEINPALALGGQSQTQGSGATQIGDPNTAPSKNDLDMAKYLVESGKNSSIQVGNVIVSMNPDTGQVEARNPYQQTQDAYSLRNAQYTLDQARAQRNNDFKSWSDNADKQMQSLSNQIASTQDPAKVASLTNQLETLQTTAAKYKAQGGFKKGKKGISAASHSGGSQKAYSYKAPKVVGAHKAPSIRATSAKVKSHKVRLAKT
jgi:hypothetical protein